MDEPKRLPAIVTELVTMDVDARSHSSEAKKKVQEEKSEESD